MLISRVHVTQLAMSTAVAALLAAGPFKADESDSNLRAFPTPTGEIRTVSRDAIDPTNPFFQDLGTNGRRCVTCHRASDAWTIAAAHVRELFNVDGGLSDPLFRRFGPSSGGQGTRDRAQPAA